MMVSVFLIAVVAAIAVVSATNDPPPLQEASPKMVPTANRSNLSAIGETISKRVREGVENTTLGAGYCWADRGIHAAGRLQQSALSERWRVVDATGKVETFIDLGAAVNAWRDVVDQHEKAAPTPRNLEAVVLVHGLGRTRESMHRVADSLTEAGFRCYLFGYPSQFWTVEQSAECLNDTISRLCEKRIHLVGYSLGGLVIRQALKTKLDPRLKRAVLMGTPNHGAEAAGFWSRTGRLGKTLGPALMQLRTDSKGLSCQLPSTLPIEFAVIAGAVPKPLSRMAFIPEPNDLLVTVASTKVEGSTAFGLVPYHHGGLIYWRQPREMVVSFLKTGSMHSQHNSK